MLLYARLCCPVDWDAPARAPGSILASLMVELTRFRGHIILCVQGVENVQSTTTDRKFNRMRPSMARVLALETRSAKEG